MFLDACYISVCVCVCVCMLTFSLIFVNFLNFWGENVILQCLIESCVVCEEEEMEVWCVMVACHSGTRGVRLVHDWSKIGEFEKLGIKMGHCDTVYGEKEIQ